MNIRDGLHQLPEVAGVTETSGVSGIQRQTSETVTGTDATAQDTTELSPEARFASQAMQVPDVRLDKVAAVQQALSSGNYQVSAEDVAEKMIRQMVGK
ncbi:flagellar biosynthesis anti-sigma factor FlgM [Pseudacidobacterium ailaaui]|jgi:negative regulator of flagellin synthesis FlgM|uniref:flagellar biosynthesis anti-sigma factor FlgM n=1 Tax=Pseudacidobacterium ailaaui TaxID=1382359 RepID=UPI0006790532|nr:flagellar biosynthesis anti-sigma factor FlgM [Pseudacidobacterium ailaaui]MBX6358460.1 flagellar biosynthesis anti-sigma factor FlgM [Pseudacidobacterium ailaaui]MCL6464006.1 flagellar biosynthesis anti-sigma factor FlgM [Pseudacidobacterium ailaaui]MDI3254264.1 flagellar biosynthesis anti-sigma factor FlgM [Bacillota bacterium]